MSLARNIIVAILLILLCSCSPRIIEHTIIQRDTTKIVQRDSVRFYDRDSIFIREKGDTVYQYVERWRWRDRVRIDTLLRCQIDSVLIEKIKEVPAALSPWQNFRLKAFGYLLGAIVAALLWIFRKFIF